MKKLLLLATTITLLLVSCGSDKKTDNLLAYSSGSTDDYTYVTIDDKVFVPFTTVDNRERGEWIGIVDNDENDRIYEYKGHSSDDWVISYYNSGEMDISMLMKKETITDSPEYPMLVKVNDVVYKNTGYICATLGCGTMDGRITSTVDISETPSENNQSNFGTDIEYQYISDAEIIVFVDGSRTIFRDINSTNKDIPIEVANFTATIKEVRNDGMLLVTFNDMPDIFISLPKEDYLIDGSSIDCEFSEGDTIRVWYDGNVENSSPAIISNVYKIVL